MQSPFYRNIYAVETADETAFSEGPDIRGRGPPAPSPTPAPPAEEASGSGGGASGQQSGDAPPPPSPAPAAATTTAYTTNNLNQYTRVGTATYAYDKNGNLTSDGSKTYRWDAENRLTGVTIPGVGEGTTSTVVSYAYDDYHRRVKKTVGSTTTYFLWSGDRLLAEYAGDGTLTRRYLYAGGFAPAQVQDISGSANTAYDVHTDRLDTARLLTNRTGAAVWRSRHRAFGRPTSRAIPTATVPSSRSPSASPASTRTRRRGFTTTGIATTIPIAGGICQPIRSDRQITLTSTSTRAAIRSAL